VENLGRVEQWLSAVRCRESALNAPTVSRAFNAHSPLAKSTQPSVMASTKKSQNQLLFFGHGKK